MLTIHIQDINFEKLELLNSDGQEADIFSDGKLIYKIYKNSNKSFFVKERKLDILSTMKLSHAVIPIMKIRNSHSLCGCVMNYIEEVKIKEYSLTTKELITLFKCFSTTVKEYHGTGVIIGDFHMNNILLPNLENYRFIDLDGAKIKGLASDHIPTLTYHFLETIKINKVSIDEKFDNLSIILAFLYLLFDNLPLYRLEQYELDKLIKEKEIACEAPLIRKLRKGNIDIPYFYQLF